MRYLNFILAGVLTALLLSCAKGNEIIGDFKPPKTLWIEKLNDPTFKCMVADFSETCETFGVTGIFDKESYSVTNSVKNIRQQDGKVQSTCKDELICTIAPNKEGAYVVSISKNIHERFSKIEISWSRTSDMKTIAAEIYYENGAWICDGYSNAEKTIQVH